MPDDASQAADRGEYIMLSALNHFLYCGRRCALIHVEGVFRDNVYTVEGTIQHEAADTPGYESQPGARVIRAFPLYSDRLGLTGKTDIVELRGRTPFPVEYKRGKRKQWDNDDVQICAQALCLEEMFKVEVPAGAVFHAASKRRREVLFTPALRELTEETVKSVRRLVEQKRIPAAILKPQCEGCSLRPDCMPELNAAVVHGAARRVFEVKE